ncbi:MAG: ROK family protein [Saprospiraceae bacterium]|nr:ROK family protein [Saprospiraceae bacterium]
MNQPLFGIDLGGTKIEGVVIASRTDPSVIARLRLPTESEKGYEHIIGQITRVVAMLEESAGIKATKIGIGVPGNNDPVLGVHKNANTTCLNGQPFKADLAKRLGIEVNMANDANCFAVAEANLGAVPDVLPNAEVVFGVIMGTGVGGGLVVNRRVWNGRQGIGGEWGHNFLDASGGKCYCGLTGCVETIISGPALERFYHAQTGTKKKLRDIMDSVETDEAARATKERLIYFFGRAISQIVNAIDPDAIILGGGVGNIDALYTEGVAEAAKYVFNSRLDTLFLKPKLGDSAGVFGAALL